MPTDQRVALLYHPLGQNFFDFAALLDILGGAGGVMGAKQLERPPQSANEKLNEGF